MFYTFICVWCNTVQYNAMQCNAMQWNELDCIGMGQNGTKRMEWNGCIVICTHLEIKAMWRFHTAVTKNRAYAYNAQDKVYSSTHHYWLLQMELSAAKLVRIAKIHWPVVEGRSPDPVFTQHDSTSSGSPQHIFAQGGLKKTKKL